MLYTAGRLDASGYAALTAARGARNGLMHRGVLSEAGANSAMMALGYAIRRQFGVTPQELHAAVGMTW